MTWFQKLKFSSNPLDVRPNHNLVGLEQQEAQLKNHIKKEEICFINGLTGAGKTSLLMKVQNDMKGHKFIYLDAHDLPKEFNLSLELRKKRGFFDKIWLRNFPKKKPVLIIDEFQATDPNVILEARAKWENPNQKRIKSIVISQISKELNNVTPSFKERLGSRIIMLDTLDDEELKKILENRLYNKKTKTNYTEKFSDDAMSFLIRCSGGNPRRLLEYADEIFDFHHRKFGDRNPMLLDSYVVSYHGMKEILGIDKVFVDGFDHLDERKEIIENTKMNKKSVDTFDQKFTDVELKILKFIKAGPKTKEQIAQRLKISTGTASRHLNSLKRKKSILYAGKKKNKFLYQIDPATKRFMVKV